MSPLTNQMHEARSMVMELSIVTGMLRRGEADLTPELIKSIESMLFDLGHLLTWTTLDVSGIEERLYSEAQLGESVAALTRAAELLGRSAPLQRPTRARVDFSDPQLVEFPGPLERAIYWLSRRPDGGKGGAA